MDLSQKKYKREFELKAEKGVKSFDFKVGDYVFRRNNKNKDRKGGKMDKIWLGPYKILDIDTRKRVKLCDSTDKEIKTRYAWSQLRPFVNGDLKCIQETDDFNTVHSGASIPNVGTHVTGDWVDDVDILADFQKADKLNTVNSETSIPNGSNITDVSTLLTGDWLDDVDIPDDFIKTDDLNTVHSGTSIPNSLNLSNIVTGDWLDDLDIENAQKILAQKFSGYGLISPTYLGNVEVYEKHLKRLKSTAEDSAPFMQIVHVHGNHWIVMSNAVSETHNHIIIYDSLFTPFATEESFYLHST